MRVSDVAAARAAEEQGAKAIAIDRAIDGIREATTLPLLWTGAGPALFADALMIDPDDEAEHDGLETVVHVRDEEELALALEQLDPEIFLLSARGGNDDDDPLETVLELLPDVPAGKLAIADVEVESRADVLALERAGIDAVLVHSARVAELSGSPS